MARHLYECLGIVGHEPSGTATMPLGADAWARAAPAASFGLLLERTCFLPLADLEAVPTDIAVDVLDDGAGVEAAIATACVLRRGRSLAVTGGRVVAAGDASRLLAVATLAWSIIGTADVVAAPDADDPDARAAPPGDLFEGLGIAVTGPGRCELADVGPSVAGPGGVLHAGAHQLLGEAAARSAIGDGAVVSHLALRFLAAARQGPFVAQATVEAAASDHVVCTITVREAGDDRLVSHGIAHVVPRPPSR